MSNIAMLCVKRANGDSLYDLLVTSPPYGDNRTTVPYGQHAFLPLQWVELSDIGKDIPYDCAKDDPLEI